MLMALLRLRRRGNPIRFSCGRSRTPPSMTAPAKAARGYRCAHRARPLPAMSAPSSTCITYTEPGPPESIAFEHAGERVGIVVFSCLIRTSPSKRGTRELCGEDGLHAMRHISLLVEATAQGHRRRRRLPHGSMRRASPRGPASVLHCCLLARRRGRSGSP